MKRNRWLVAFGILLAGAAAAFSVFLHAGWKQVKLVYPSAIAVDNTGNIYIADANNYTVDKLTPGGKLSILAGSPGKYGAAGGQGEQARFGQPAGIAVGPDGSIFVSDSANQMIYKITQGGTVTILAGARWQLSFAELKEHLNSGAPVLEGFADGMGTAARFSSPRGVTVDSAGNVYVADQGNNVIRKITPDGMVSTLAGTPGKRGHDDGMGAAASFSLPTSLAIDGSGNVYVADGVIRKITPDGMVTTLFGTAGEYGYADGVIAQDKLGAVRSIAADSAGNIYFVSIDSTTSGWLSRITPDGTLSRPGSDYARGSRYGRAVAVDRLGDTYLITSRGLEKVLRTGQSSDLVKQPQYDQGPIARLVDYLPHGGLGLAAIAAAFAYLMLLVMAFALTVNGFLRAAWKAALKSPPPSVSYPLAALTVTGLLTAFLQYSYQAFNTYYSLGGVDLPAVTLITLRFAGILRFVPILTFILILLMIPIRSVRRQTFFAGILAGTMFLAAVVVGSMFWPIFMSYTG